MTPPIRHLSPEWIPEHPALQYFTEFVRDRQKTSPLAERILVKNAQPQDGFIDLEYTSGGNIFLGRLDAHAQRLQLHHGQVKTGKSKLDIVLGPVDWGEGPVELPIAAACRTLHFLGGAQESEVQCRDDVKDSRLSNKLWALTAMFFGWAVVESSFSMLKRRSLTQELFRTFREGMRWTPAATKTIPRHLLREGPAAGLGLLAMQLSAPLSDAFGLHPRDERYERWSLAVGLGFLGYTESRGLLNIGTRKISTNPFSLGAGLMSAAFADATAGLFWEEGDWRRKLVRETGFFLPAFWQGIQGERQLALLTRPKVAATTRWGGRLFLGGFLADLGYMVYNHWIHGQPGAVLQNRLYARASVLQDQETNPFVLLLKGAFSFLAPALTERFFPSENQVRRAAEEMKHQDLRYVTSLEDIQKPGGKVLPVTAVAEQLSDPQVRERLADFTEAELILYVQREFRAYRLTEPEVREMLQRIAPYQAREPIPA